MGRGGSKALFHCLCSLAPLAGFRGRRPRSPKGQRDRVRGRKSPVIWSLWPEGDRGCRATPRGPDDPWARGLPWGAKRCATSDRDSSWTTAEGGRGIARTMASRSPKHGEKYGCLVLSMPWGAKRCATSDRDSSRTTAEGRRGIARTMASGSPKRGQKYGCLVFCAPADHGCWLLACCTWKCRMTRLATSSLRPCRGSQAKTAWLGIVSKIGSASSSTTA